MTNSGITRKHNKLTKKGLMLHKVSFDIDKINDEFEWMNYMNKNQYIPSVAKDEDGYLIRFIESSNLGEIFWNSPMYKQEIILDFYFDFIKSMNSDDGPNHLNYLLLEKFNSRVEYAKKAFPQLNGIVESYLKNIGEVITRIESNDSMRGLMHGDLFLGNTLYDGERMFFIDPRGLESSYKGSLFYDVVKLSHSIHGQYDNVIFDKEYVKNKKIVNYFYENIKTWFNIDKNDVVISQIGLFISMLEIHKDSPENQEKFVNIAMQLEKEVKWKN